MSADPRTFVLGAITAIWILAGTIGVVRDAYRWGRDGQPTGRFTLLHLPLVLLAAWLGHRAWRRAAGRPTRPERDGRAPVR